MTRTKKLAVLLRVIGGTTLLALFAVFMSMSWIASSHQWLGQRIWVVVHTEAVVLPREKLPSGWQ